MQKKNQKKIKALPTEFMKNFIERISMKTTKISKGIAEKFTKRKKKKEILKKLLQKFPTQ